MLSLHQLRTFLEVARTGSVREGAENLVVSQPAISAALAGLQQRIGVRLVERSGRGLRVTPSGRQLERYGRRILALVDEAERSAHDAALPNAGHVRLAAVTTAAEHVIPGLLSGFRSRYPLVDVELEVGNRGHVWGRLAHWEVDLVIGGRPPRDPAFRTLATRRNALVVVEAPGASRTADVSSATWLLREPGSGTRATTQELFALMGIAPTCLTIGSNGAIRECVRAGLGVSLLAQESVSRELREGLLSIVETTATPLARDWHFVVNSEAGFSPSASRFVDYAIETAAFVPADSR